MTIPEHENDNTSSESQNKHRPQCMHPPTDFKLIDEKWVCQQCGATYDILPE